MRSIDSESLVQDDSRGRNEGIDLLRGLSILLVVFEHIATPIPLGRTLFGSILPTWLLQLASDRGVEAVYVFFVISGFLIATNALNRWHNLAGIQLYGFYARRFARIAPCLLALIAMLSVLDLSGVTEYMFTRHGQSLKHAIVAALGLHVNWYAARTGWLPPSWDVLWSLSIEEMFYLIFPIICLLVRREYLMLPMLLALALSLPSTRAAIAGNEIWREKAYLPGMAAIATGVAAAIVTRHLRPDSAWLRGMMLWGGGSVLCGLFLFEDVIYKVLPNSDMLILTISAACLITGFDLQRRSGGTPALFGTGWLRSYGRNSYEIYLTHMFIVFLIVRIFRATGSDLRFGFFWYAMAIMLSGVLGTVVESRLSEPCNRWLRKLLLGPGRPAVSDSARRQAGRRIEGPIVEHANGNNQHGGHQYD